MSRRGWPHELIRASAGTGKTFQVSNRILGLLAGGVEPERVLASTFTRKAAGEILDRVLLRLADAALEPTEAAALAGHISLPEDDAPPAPMDAARAGDLLKSLVRELHRLDVGTLDAFFMRLARSFGPELGLPLTWEISETADQEETRSEAIQALLDDGDVGRLVELLRMIGRGEHGRRVHDRLAEDVDDLQEVLRELDPAATSPWSPFSTPAKGGDPVAERAALAARLAEVRPPRNKNGSEHAGWSSALAAAVAAIRDGAWEGLWTKGFGAKWLGGESEYYGKPFPPGLPVLLEAARELSRAALGSLYDRQARAMGEIAGRYDAALSALQRRTGAYRFADVAFLLGGSSPIGARPDVHHRLDRRSEHLLLDEFQDTSLAQWAALEPVADEIAPEGSLVVVADPKQSIYGWRNADPDLVDRVERRYGLPTRDLHRSWRSSPVVLGFVNELFDDLAANPVLAELEGGSEVAAKWGATFEEHEAAPSRRESPGHVIVEVGPDDPGRGTDRPRLMARAAERVAGLHATIPGAEIGVLVSQNKTVARLIHELRRKGVLASEEGGTPVDDAAPVSALLSLLRLADHPGDTIARYHVAAGPLGEVVGYRDFRDAFGARRLAARIRARLLRDGYGATLSEWTERLAGSVEENELRRLEQLVELGFRWESRATLRPADFVRYVESHRVEDPLSAPVRVMTVHQAKGLEFDVVVLPELDVGLAPRGSDTAVPERDPDSGRIRRVFPYVKADLRPLFPELREAYRQRRASRLRDQLSWLYVAVTRARFELHLLVAADEGPRRSTAMTFARIVRAVVGADGAPTPEGEILYERGDADWFRTVDGMSERPEARPSAEPRVRVDAAAPRTRILARRSPSELESGSEIDLERLLRLDTSAARVAGTVVHRWCEAIEWIEDGIPGDGALRELVRDVAADMPTAEVDRLAARFRSWMERPEVRGALSRNAARARAREVAGGQGTPELHRERPFACRLDGEVMSGVIDRLVLVRSGSGSSGGPGAGAVVAAEVLDFKTDELAEGDETALAARTDFYRPQIEAYREAVAAMYGLDAAALEARLVFLVPGAVREVGE
ncbi:MAG: UvrD-helicase domain-containing protein [Candidatus Palauibacterales bacterium]|nr:UvrD-helicase domain-containing protein [Candidatus Palauibacterales bacterium]MDP2530243.1 UvrD-helicase domain-containing protein [Candidatus Palauibacterales bacterium]MDP2583028.1 UvrD-helicase domain-containing protein [Candidatus Palauibacterales bacterium]